MARKSKKVPVRLLARKYADHFRDLAEKDPNDQISRDSARYFEIVYRLVPVDETAARKLYDSASKWSLRKAENHARSVLLKAITNHPQPDGISELTTLLNRPYSKVRHPLRDGVNYDKDAGRNGVNYERDSGHKGPARRA